ncbi:MAG: MFS transporter [Proteobacteria bacterium]|nr:MFS transporter [Pseudomonadota bacterium]
MSKNFRWIVLAALSVIAFLINMDYSAVNLALIPMAADLHASLNTIQWTLGAYVLAWAVFVIPAGVFVDKYGKRNMCLLGIGIFVLASLFAGIASSAGALIASRVLQGIGGAIFIPTLYALIYVNFEEYERGKAMGMISLGVGLGLAAGPFIGGILLEWLGWPGIFFINIPIGLAALSVIYLNRMTEQLQTDIKINKSSVALLSVAIISVLYLLGNWHAWSQQVTFSLGLVLVAFMSFFSFIFAQRKLATPLIPLNIFTHAPFLGCIIGMLLEQFSFSAILVTTGLYLQKVLQLPVLTSSMVYLAFTVIFGIIAAMGGSWVDRVGLKKPIIIGLLLTGLAALLFIWLSSSNDLRAICSIFIVFGIGLGLAFAGLNTAILKTAPQGHIGIATGVFLMFALLGNAFSVTITTMVYEKQSLVKLVESVTPSAEISVPQRSQLATYVSNVGAKEYDLSAFTQPIQTTILNETPSALNYGVNSAMFVNFVALMLATLACGMLMRSQREEKSVAEMAS